MDEAAQCDLLEESIETGRLVKVAVLSSVYRCCGGGWSERGPDEYVGRVLSLDVDSFLLQVSNDLGKMAEVIASTAALVSVQIVN